MFIGLFSGIKKTPTLLKTSAVHQEKGSQGGTSKRARARTENPSLFVGAEMGRILEGWDECCGERKKYRTIAIQYL